MPKSLHPQPGRSITHCTWDDDDAPGAVLEINGRAYVAVDHLIEFLSEPGKSWGPYPAAAARVREEWGR